MKFVWRRTKHGSLVVQLSVRLVQTWLGGGKNKKTAKVDELPFFIFGTTLFKKLKIHSRKKISMQQMQRIQQR